MKNLILAFISLVSFSAIASQTPRNLIHVLPDAPSSFYHSVLKNQMFLFADNLSADQDVQTAVKLGERNMNWLKFMNSFRDEANQLRLTKPGELTGVPITAPKKYNPEINSEKIISDWSISLKFKLGMWLNSQGDYYKTQIEAYKSLYQLTINY